MYISICTGCMYYMYVYIYICVYSMYYIYSITSCRYIHILGYISIVKKQAVKFPLGPHPWAPFSGCSSGRLAPGWKMDRRNQSMDDLWIIYGLWFIYG